MSSLTFRDFAVMAILMLGAAATVTLALLGKPDWGIAVVGVLVVIVGVILRVQFASRRATAQGAARLLLEVEQVREGLTSLKSASVGTERMVARLGLRMEDVQKQLADMQSVVARGEAELAAIRQDVANIDAGVLELGVAGSESRSESKQSAATTRRLLLRELEPVNQTLERIHVGVAGVARNERQLVPELMTDMQALMQLMSRYNPTAPLPLVAGWALSPAGLLWLVDAIERRDAELVVECGSGTSTLWMAHAMRSKGAGRVIAFEHLAEYAEKTRAMLDDHGLSAWAEVRVSPLVDVETPRGVFRWYDIDTNSIGGPIDVLFVDGPPGVIGKYARYPALSRFATVLTDDTVIVVDDADRPDEREVLRFWAEESPDLVEIASPARGVRVLANRANGS